MAVKIPKSLINMLLVDLELKSQDIIVFSLLGIIDQEPDKILINDNGIVTGVTGGKLK